MPENTEAMPEISASPAPQDAKPADTGEKKQKKPRNTSGMKPPLNQLPPEEAFAIRSKGGKAADKKRREEKLVKDQDLVSILRIILSVCLMYMVEHY